MATPIRKKVVKIGLDAADALKGLKVFEKAFQATANVVDKVAGSIEKSADRAAAALAKLGQGAGAVREAARGSGGGSGPKAPSGYGAGSKFKEGATGRGRGGLGGASEYKETAKSIEEVGEAGAKAAKGLGVMGVALGDLTAKAVAWGASKIVDVLQGAASAAIDAESKLKQISKVIDDSSPENIARIEQGIKDLSVELGVLPSEVGDLTAALAAAGPGIQADLLGYAELATKVGVAFDLSGAEAGTALSSLTASLGLSKDELTSLLGTINELDAGMNSSSKQLTNYLTEVAGIGRAASISGETMLALGSAIISTGVNEDKAATGVKNFIATLESGTAATDAVSSAFHKLGFDAVDVAKQMATGNAEAEIKKISAAIALLPPEERFATLIDLFGKESIGSVGGLATNVDLLGQSFAIAADKTKSMTSVQKEFDNVSGTTEHQIKKLKAGIGVLAIEFGNALLPTIKKVVEFLNSPEGQEWGKQAIAKAIEGIQQLVEVATALWPVLQTVGSVIGKVAGFLIGLVENLGGATVAAGLFAAKMIALGGPAGILAGVATIGVTVGYKLAEALFGPAEAEADIFGKKINEVMSAAMVKVNEFLTKTRDAVKESNAALEKENNRKKQILDAGFSGAEQDAKAKQAGLAAREKFLKNKKGNNVKLTDEEAAAMKLEIQKAMVESRIAYGNAAEAAGGGPPPEVKAKQDAAQAGKEARFAYLDANRKKLLPDEQKEYNKLSKDLNKRKSHDAPKGHKAPEHFASDDLEDDGKKTRFAELGAMGKKRTPSQEREYSRLSKDLDIRKAGKMSKEDQALANMDSSLADVLRSGSDDGGVHDDPLSRAVFGHATGASARGGSGGIGAGPNINNITNNNQQISTIVNQTIDARSERGVADNVRASAKNAGEQAAQVVLTGASQVVGLRNAGAVLR